MVAYLGCHSYFYCLFLKPSDIFEVVRRMTAHRQWMQRALQLAEKGRGHVSPNPMVGCVIVNEGQLVAEAYHHKAGCAHAEILALDQAGNKAKSACLYLTLEPCCHTGRTPPCVHRVIESGVKTVVIASKDTNPLVAGKSVQMLKESGIEVVLGVCEQEALTLNHMFFHAMKYQRPYVIAKWAMSLDGCMQTNTGDVKQITGQQAQHHVHQQRRSVDAILIGANTLLDDDPQLTARLDANEVYCPIRIILTNTRELPLTHQVFNDEFAYRTWVITSHNNRLIDEIELEKKRVKVFRLEHEGDSLLPGALMEFLHTQEIRSLYVEGGRKTLAYFFNAQLVDEIHSYIAPCVIAGLYQKEYVQLKQKLSLGDDTFFQATIKNKES